MSTVKALIIQPDGTGTYIREYSTELSNLQATVGGYIEGIHTDQGYHAYVNEEGRLTGLPHNPVATAILRTAGGDSGFFVVGPVVFLGDDPTDSGDEYDIPDTLIPLAVECGVVLE